MDELKKKKWLKIARQGLRKCPGHKGYKDCYDENHKCLKCGGYKRGEWYLVNEDDDYTYHICL